MFLVFLTQVSLSIEGFCLSDEENMHLCPNRPEIKIISNTSELNFDEITGLSIFLYIFGFLDSNTYIIDISLFNFEEVQCFSHNNTIKIDFNPNSLKKVTFSNAIIDSFHFIDFAFICFFDTTFINPINLSHSLSSNLIKIDTFSLNSLNLSKIETDTNFIICVNCILNQNLYITIKDEITPKYQISSELNNSQIIANFTDKSDFFTFLMDSQDVLDSKSIVIEKISPNFYITVNLTHSNFSYWQDYPYLNSSHLTINILKENELQKEDEFKEEIITEETSFYLNSIYLPNCRDSSRTIVNIYETTSIYIGSGSPGLELNLFATVEILLTDYDCEIQYISVYGDSNLTFSHSFKSNNENENDNEIIFTSEIILFTNFMNSFVNIDPEITITCGYLEFYCYEKGEIRITEGRFIIYQTVGFWKSLIEIDYLTKENYAIFSYILDLNQTQNGIFIVKKQYNCKNPPADIYFEYRDDEIPTDEIIEDFLIKETPILSFPGLLQSQINLRMSSFSTVPGFSGSINLVRSIYSKDTISFILIDYPMKAFPKFCILDELNDDYIHTESSSQCTKEMYNISTSNINEWKSKTANFTYSISFYINSDFDSDVIIDLSNVNRENSLFFINSYPDKEKTIQISTCNVQEVTFCDLNIKIIDDKSQSYLNASSIYFLGHSKFLGDFQIPNCDSLVFDLISYSNFNKTKFDIKKCSFVIQSPILEIYFSSIGWTFNITNYIYHLNYDYSINFIFNFSTNSISIYENLTQTENNDKVELTMNNSLKYHIMSTIWTNNGKTVELNILSDFLENDNIMYIQKYSFNDIYINTKSSKIPISFMVIPSLSIYANILEKNCRKTNEIVFSAPIYSYTSLLDINSHSSPLVINFIECYHLGSGVIRFPDQLAVIENLIIKEGTSFYLINATLNEFLSIGMHSKLYMYNSFFDEAELHLVSSAGDNEGSVVGLSNNIGTILSIKVYLNLIQNIQMENNIHNKVNFNRSSFNDIKDDTEGNILVIKEIGEQCQKVAKNTRVENDDFIPFCDEYNSLMVKNMQKERKMRTIVIIISSLAGSLFIGLTIFIIYEIYSCKKMRNSFLPLTSELSFT
ncbi:hypothetical protein TRFO_29837 [Tritrichomonas foetus]|uniref:Uncharacterized protein n=1 Tax=Tritrichomonas foetus TaxID=1144522 RepID=A0A1J4JW23_9EUKA|nr:hypothetical protein TRFO_29837 [Tritrichomonas foetus]|eukprot:OHT02914.1 hypothetical protein TRFO_29837 [Tritrichomonas foetus]